MNADCLLFFDRHMDAMPLYEALENRILNEIENVWIKVQKSQISFYNKHLFTCVSFAKVRKKSACPASYIVVTIGLAYKLESPRVEIATEPYPNRWTHHLLIADTEEIDDELMTWIKEAAVFADAK
ncbi:DUF5655 domain-containing protein [Roseburia hominis]